jgi:hypothetical protein
MHACIAPISAVLLSVSAGCKREPKPLEPPDPATRAIELSWGMGPDGTYQPTHTFELALTPDRRFRYRWRTVEEPASWREITGGWEAAGARKWVLRPDLGSASLEGGEQDTFPTLKWTRHIQAVGPDAPDLASGTYLIPAVDPETARFLTKHFVMQSDPRLFRRD